MKDDPRDIDEMNAQSGEYRSKPPSTLGLVVAPEMAADISEQIVAGLAELLANYVDDGFEWRVGIVVDPLVGAAEDSASILEKVAEYKRLRDWNYVICITDLPVRRDGRFVVAEASAEYMAGLISLPAFGFTSIRRRISEAILQITSEMHHGISEAARARQEEETKNSDKVRHSMRGQGARELLGWYLYETLFPIRRITSKDKSVSGYVRFIARARINGTIRILAGMVRTNRPWRIFRAFKSVIAVAFATGAYGLVFPSLWQLSDSYGWPRLLTLMCAAIMAMVVWLIIAHGLWEPMKTARSSSVARLYNTVTILTLGISVVFYYAVLLGLFVIAVVIFVPGTVLESHLHHAAGIRNYLVLAWLAASIATIAGAVGAGFEDKETVRKATYGYRQRQRVQEARPESG